jgi:D-alanyl-D-alanine carboxypeptidase (penicillin-binding protein 5/6)
VNATYDSFNLIVEKNQADEIDKQITMNGSVDAPIQKGDLVGMLVCSMDGELLYEAPIYSIESVEKNTFGNLFAEILKKYFLI